MRKNSSENQQKNRSKILKFVLTAFVVLSIGTVVYKAVKPSYYAKNPEQAKATVLTEPFMETAKPLPAFEVKKTTFPAKPVSNPIQAKTAVVYYFHTTVRCYSCTMLETYTREAVEKNFASQYKGWKVEFVSVNVEEPAHSHFIQDYRLNAKSVIVQKFEGNKPMDWINLDKVWYLLGNKESFINYATEEIRKLLDKK